MTGNHANPSQQRSGPASPDQKPLRVLLIEDDDEMREMLAETLTREGWQVTQRRDAFEWLQWCVRQTAVFTSGLNSNRYDVVVSDIRMPRIDGLDVLRILRDINCTNACPPTILITAFGDEQTHQRARELGAAAVLDKPFAVRDLVQKVRELAAT